MVDYAEPFRRSIEAAEKATSNRNEVDSMFAHFNEALRTMTDGKAQIVRAPTFVESVRKLVASYTNPDDQSSDDMVLAVANPTQPTFRNRTIAKWKQAAEGYPCTVIWGERHASCEDGQALYHELVALFSSSIVGAAIRAAEHFVPSPPALPAQEQDAPAS